MKTQITHPVIGNVTVSRTKRSRRISISVRPPGQVRLSMPHSAAVSEALAFLNSKTEWVASALEKMAATALQPAAIEMPYSTRTHELRLEPARVERITVKILPPRDRANGLITVTYPLEANTMSESVQQAIRRGIEQAWRAEAKQVLPAKIEELARSHGFRYRSVTVRNTRSRWGSCSARDDISLSIRLMNLPDRLVDYIVLHELCHTVHKNHGPKFHALLDRVTGGQHALLRKEIRSYR